MCGVAVVVDSGRHKCCNLYWTLKCWRNATVQEWSVLKPDICWKSRFLPTPSAIIALLGGPLRKIVITLCTEKTRMLGLPDGEKFWRYLLILTEYTNVTDRWTDRQTLHDSIGHTYPHIHIPWCSMHSGMSGAIQSQWYKPEMMSLHLHHV